MSIRDDFARDLVQRVRDVAIQETTAHLDPNMIGPVSRRWQRALALGDTSDFAQMAIVDAVDETIFGLLTAVQNGEIALAIRSTEGDEWIDLASLLDLEASGEYLADEQHVGWRRLYSTERVNSFEVP